MKKSTLFISAVLSAFMLAVLASAVAAYRSLAGAGQVTSQQSAPVVQEAAAPAAISPEQAAQIAARFMSRSDLYSVESSSLNGGSAYKVTFSSGDVVYVNLKGQVLTHISVPVLSSIPSSASSLQQTTTRNWLNAEEEHEGGDDD